MKKPVVVDEQYVGVEVEQLRGDTSRVIVETQVNERQLRGAEDVARETTEELVVTKVDLVEVAQLGNVAVDDAAEVVGVGVEDGDVRQVSDESVEVEEAAAEPGPVEVNAGESGYVQVRYGVAEEAFEEAVVVSDPSGGVSKRVVRDVSFELLCNEEDSGSVGQRSRVIGWLLGQEFKTRRVERRPWADARVGCWRWRRVKCRASGLLG